MTCVEAERGAPLRVVVVGTSGAGKSTFSAALAARLGCTHVELDRLYWGPGWQAVPHERFEHAVERATTAPRWSPTATTAPSASCSGAAPPTWYG